MSQIWNTKRDEGATRFTGQCINRGHVTRHNEIAPLEAYYVRRGVPLAFDGISPSRVASRVENHVERLMHLYLQRQYTIPVPVGLDAYTWYYRLSDGRIVGIFRWRHLLVTDNIVIYIRLLHTVAISSVHSAAFFRCSSVPC